MKNMIKLLNKYKIKKADLKFFLFVADISVEQEITDSDLIGIIHGSIKLREKSATGPFLRNKKKVVG